MLLIQIETFVSYFFSNNKFENQAQSFFFINLRSKYELSCNVLIRFIYYRSMGPLFLYEIISFYKRF